MSNIVRGCNPLDFTGILSVSGEKYEGPFSGLMNEVLNQIQANKNISLKIRSKQDGVGEPLGVRSADTSFDGCIGQLQANKSDFMLQLADYPIGAVNITQGDIGLDSSTGFIGVYNPRTIKDVDATPIDTCFSIFSPRIWSLCIALGFFIYCVVFIRGKLMERVKERKKVARILSARCKWRMRATSRAPRLVKEEDDESGGCTLYELVTHVTGFGAVGDSGAFMKTIFITCSLYGFLIFTNYFCGLISTELVTVSPPDIFTTYQDLIDNKVSLFFVDGQQTYMNFRFASNGSKKRQLWDMSVEKQGEENLKVNADNFFLFSKCVREIILRHNVVAIDSLFMRIFMREICRLSVDKSLRDRLGLLINMKFKGPMPFYAIDPAEASVLKGIIYSGHFKGKLYEILRHRLITQRETGLLKKTLQNVDEVGAWSATFLIGEKIAGSSQEQIKLCSENVVLVPEVTVESVSMPNVKNFISSCIYLMIALFSVLLFEIVTARTRFFRLKRKKN